LIDIPQIPPIPSATTAGSEVLARRMDPGLLPDSRPARPDAPTRLPGDPSSFAAGWERRLHRPAAVGSIVKRDRELARAADPVVELRQAIDDFFANLQKDVWWGG
jgi:hypothetical protein